VDRTILQQIQRVKLKASFGSKIDNLTRHLLVVFLFQPRVLSVQWIKTQGGAKALVFSQWSDGMLSLDSQPHNGLVLEVMERSFKLNGISYVRFDQKLKGSNDAVQLFKGSPEIQVFMLHSQSQSYVNSGSSISN
jgi:hypothetical protein